MATALPVIIERERAPDGCHTARVEPDLSVQEARGLAVIVKALADPTRLRIVDALRIASPEAVCQCELLPLFDISQAALAKHLQVLVRAGLLGVQRRGLWAYYFIADEFSSVVLCTSLGLALGARSLCDVAGRMRSGRSRSCSPGAGRSSPTPTPTERSECSA